MWNRLEKWWWRITSLKCSVLILRQLSFETNGLLYFLVTLLEFMTSVWSLSHNTTQILKDFRVMCVSGTVDDWHGWSSHSVPICICMYNWLLWREWGLSHFTTLKGKWVGTKRQVTVDIKMKFDPLWPLFIFPTGNHHSNNKNN